MKFSIGAGKYKKAFLASALFVFALFAGGEFIKASTYDKIAKIYGEILHSKAAGSLCAKALFYLRKGA